MTLTALGLVLGSVLLTAGAQLALKLASSRYAQPSQDAGLLTGMAEQFLHPLTIAAIVAYVGSLALWLLALRHLPLSLAYPMSGLTIAIVVAMGMIVLGESLNWQQSAGIVLIVGGVLLLARS